MIPQSTIHDLLAQSPLAHADAAVLFAATGSFDWLGLVARVVHILGAVILAGGTFYLCAVHVPGVTSIEGEAAERLEEALRRRWSKLVMLSSLMLIASGFYNYFAIISLDREGIYELPRFYHPLIGTKILLAFFIFFVAAILSGRSAAAARFRAKSRMWLTINSLAIVVVICLAAVLKTADKTPVEVAPPKGGPFAQRG